MTRMIETSWHVYYTKCNCPPSFLCHRKLFVLEPRGFRKRRGAAAKKMSGICEGPENLQKVKSEE